MTRALIIRFSLPILVWLAVYCDAISSMVSVWHHSKTYEHCFIIIPIALWLVWQKKEQLSQSKISNAFLPIVLLIIPAMIWMIGKTAGIALFEHAAVVLSFQLILWALLGNTLAKQLFFPIAYLWFCIPFGEELVPYLQLLTADMTVFALQLSNIPVYREGLFLTIPNGLFEVAEACSGIRFLISSIALGTLFAYLNFHTLWKILAFIGFSFIFPIIANGIRAYGIVIIGYLSDMKYATGADHLIYGWVFFCFVIGIIFYTASKFSEPLRSNKPSANKAKHLSPSHSAIVVSVIGLLVAPMVWLTVTGSSNQLSSEGITVPDSFTRITSSNWGINFPNAEESLLAISSEDQTEVYIAQNYDADIELISYQNTFFNEKNWSLSALYSRESTEFSSVGVIEIIGRQGLERTITYWYCINDYCSGSRAMTKLAKSFYRITNTPFTASFYAINSGDISPSEHKLLIVKLNRTKL